MALIIKPIAELADCEFVIPCYQRGYRWDDDQVLDLLNDLKVFSERSVKMLREQKGGDANVADYYCLQPVVVVADKNNDDLKEGERKRYVVVDGQQRLTTLFLIKKAFFPDDPWYELKIDKRPEQQEFLENERYKEPFDEAEIPNIDNFYVKMAFETILKWKKEEKNWYKNIDSLLSNEPAQGAYAAVLWLEISDKDALAAFRRLNYGKIPLTPAELIKAILFQTDCYPDKGEREIQTALAQRRAMEWDEMEHRMANPLFKAMVNQKDESVGSGIEIVLDFVADKLNNQLGPNKLSRKTDLKFRKDNFVFNVVTEWIKMQLPLRADRRQDIIEQLWEEIQQTFNKLADWYENREWYHLIGLWRLLDTAPSTRKFIDEVFKLSKSSMSKGDFTEALRKQVGDKIRLDKGLDNPNLCYLTKEETTGNRGAMINILTCLNVLTTMEEPSDLARFPFHLFKEHKTTSLEHIHPQNIEKQLDLEEAKKWVADRADDRKKAPEKVWERVANSFELYSRPEKGEERDNESELLAEAIEAAKAKVDKSIEALNTLMADKKTYEAQSELVIQHSQVLDRLFGDMAGIDPQSLHSIANMALVSQPLNSALGKRHLDFKRKTILEKEAAGDTFVPPATHLVFSKAYRSAKEEKGTPGNMKFWEPEDRQAYKEAIQHAYDYFTK